MSYESLYEIPLPTAAEFINRDVVHVNSSIRDNIREVKRSLSSSILMGPASSLNTPAADVGDVVASISAPSGTVCFPRRAVLRETTEKKRFVEMWIGNVLEVSRDVNECHDAFYSDEFFATLSFSPSEFAFMYVAEAKEPTEASEKFKFTPHLGEGFGGRKRPTIFVFRWDWSVTPCNTSLARVSPIVHQDHPVLLGQAMFSPLDKGTIYATGYELTRDGRLLGVRWCYNRPSGIWEIKIPSTNNETDEATADGLPVYLSCPSRKLTPSHLSCRSPRAYYDSATSTAKLFWLSCQSGGPHAGTFSLHVWDLAAPETASKILVDVVWDPRAPDDFPGLYLDANLPLSSFVRLGGEVFLVFSSTWESRTTVLLVSAEDGNVKDMTPDSDGKLYSWNVLATDGYDRVVSSRSTPTTPHQILVGQFDGLSVSWCVISTPYLSPSVSAALSSLAYSVISVPGRGKTQTVVVRPASPESTPPCIHFIHGGPHGATTTAFSPSTAFFAIEGYTVSQPNYSGSTGFGENTVRALVGNCGILDVGDCMATVKHLIGLGLSTEGKGKQFVMGGSHGGFLTAHLIGQFPEVFTAAVIRNPVITTDAMSSDIPDWYSNEWNIEYPIYSSPEGYPKGAEEPLPLPPRRTPDESQRIFKTSPIAYVDAVRANVLLHLGGSDLRVTPTHGRDYYHALKGNARNLRPDQDVEMHWFPQENHSLDGVEANRIVWETSRDWFNKYRA
ncbi:Alpha/Beta hydrolase protein [Mycena maculata]|uniref:acylaminoacyl-peptidase n=1 Tax=Mycena maculata TaxID=230809 RepID=A0AAD7P1R0_9AGAR|nr:Alpha/Beta hydrolase protein [Mycena maculata]